MIDQPSVPSSGKLPLDSISDQLSESRIVTHQYLHVQYTPRRNYSVSALMLFKADTTYLVNTGPGRYDIKPLVPCLNHGVSQKPNCCTE